MALLSSLKDPFISQALDTSLWTQFTAGGATFAYANGAQVIYPASTTSSTDGDISSVNNFDMSSNGAFMQVLSVPSDGGASTTDAELRIGSSSNCVDILWEGGSLFAQKKVAGVNTNLTSVTYNANTHAWWKIRELGGVTFWETSPDGLTWNLLFSATNPIPVTAVGVNISGTAFSTASSPGSFLWRYFNTPNSTNVERHLRVGDGMSRSGVAN